MMRRRFNWPIGVLALVLTVASALVIPPSKSYATSYPNFNPGRIIDDVVFFKSNTMSVSQIQSFLNSQVSVCDTDHAGFSGTSGTTYNPPWVCLKDFYENPSAAYSLSFSYKDKNGSTKTGSRTYYQNNAYKYTSLTAVYPAAGGGYATNGDYAQGYILKASIKSIGGTRPSGSISAAQIIYNAAQQYGINPQVILVTLQKEESLITDTWPAPWQYQSAMGYGCPDYQPCSSGYAGFSKQVISAAWQFRQYTTNPNNFNFAGETTRYIQYNPDKSCGGSNVFIQNQATANLYNYTPYQPNKAALDAPWGTTVTCGAYGNLDFFQYFTSWFGSTYLPLVFKTADSDKVYMLNGSKYYYIPSSKILSAYGFSRKDIGVVTSNLMKLYQSGGTLSNRTRVDGGSEIYLVDHGQLLQFPTSDLYNTYGYTITGNEQDLDPIILDSVSKGPALTEIIKASSQPGIYLMNGGKKSHISNQAAYTTMGSPIYSTRAVTTLSQSYVDDITLGAPIVIANSFVKDSSDSKVYFWDGVGLQLINGQVASNLVLAMDYVSPAIDQLPLSTRPTINQLVKDVDGKLYILDSKQKLEVQPSVITDLGFSDSDFATLPDGFINKLALPTTQFTGAFRINNGSEVYVVKSGKRYHVASATALAEQDFTFSQVANLDTRSASLFPDSGSKILAQGQLFRIGTTSTIYMVNSANTSLAIPSSQLIHAYGMTIASVQSYTSQQVAGYPDPVIDHLQYFAKDTLGNVWQVDNNGQKRPVTADISGPTVFKLDLSTLPTLSDPIFARLTTLSALTNLVRIAGQTQVYKIENGAKRWVTSRSVFDSMKLLSSDVRTVSSSFANSLPTGSPIK